MSVSARLAVATAAIVGAGMVAAAALAGPAAGQAPPTDTGNAGNVQIDGAPFDDDNNNEPHVNCDFRLKFFNFEPGTYPVTFTAQSPTDSGKILLEDTINVTSDPFFSDPYNIDDLDLAGITPHPQQGFHVKLTVDTGQGAGKHKVFWIKCVKPTPTKTKTAKPTPTKTKTVTPTKTKTTEAPTATKTTSPGALPVTGTDLSGLYLAGGGLVAAGAALLLLGRRWRRRSDA